MENEKERKSFETLCLDILQNFHYKDLLLTHKPSDIAFGVIFAAFKKKELDIFDIVKH